MWHDAVKPETERMRGSTLTLACFSMALCAACASTSREDMAEGDPLEGVNRPIHQFNETVTRRVVAPAAEAIQSAAEDDDPDGDGKSRTGEMLTRVGNVFNNLGEPKNAVNGALQGDVATVGTATARFGLNTTVGLFGMYDVAEGLGLEERDEDFGQTLGTWGAPSGPYLVAPIAGPTNTRDAAGSVVDTFLNPVSLIPIPGGTAVSAAKTGVKAANAAQNAEGVADQAPDPYAYENARLRYDMRRDAAIANMDADPALRGSEPRVVVIEHRGDQPQIVPASGEAPALPPAEGPPGGTVIDIYPVDETGAPVDLTAR